ncbi:hypothetical protein K1Y77_11195 [Halomonas qaidamensis]|uniref:Uncharacterized protein n=1 Tax=Halomonas qaidamensis TaxID=2866211 RepID=A0ABY6JNE2_9GAMM|nr:hypothetical protein [Halomonas qaidamensis]UYV18052.1 hypothetical protein K1Y77_11195 [Halomonas qaidamensis]
MPSTHANILYIGPLRPETLALLESISTEKALFVTPTQQETQWQEVQAAIPSAAQQIAKLAEASGELPYYEFNLPEFNASQPASGLYTLYPGLELIESDTQALKSVAGLLEEIGSQAVDMLVVEQPELVWPTLQALAGSQHDQQMNQLWLRVGSVPLYQDTPEVAEILSWCEQHGFELQARNEEDPDLPLLQLTRHAYYYRWKEEAKRSAKLAKQLKTAQQESEKQQAQQEKEQIEQAKKHEQQQADYQKRLKDSEEQLRQQQVKYEQLQQQNKKLQQQLTEQQAEVEALQATLEKQQAIAASVTALHQALDNKFEEHQAYLKKTVNALGQHITRCTQDK